VRSGYANKRRLYVRAGKGRIPSPSLRIRQMGKKKEQVMNIIDTFLRAVLTTLLAFFVFCAWHKLCEWLGEDDED